MQTGFVLITALIFLVVLTLVAVIAVKSTGLELRMSANNAMHTEAFEASEAPRQVTARLLEVLGFNSASGWPVSVGGATPNDQFAFPIPASVTLYNSSGAAGGTPLNWFVDIPETDFDYTSFTPVARYSGDISTDGTAALEMTADIDVQRMRTAQKQGCGLGGSEGYGGTTPNCVDFFFYITSRGVDPTNAAAYETSSVYRYVPTN